MIRLKQLLTEAGNMLVHGVNPDACEAFLRKYPKVRTVMTSIARKNKDLMRGYKQFLAFKDKNEKELGGRPETTKSTTFGEKTYWKYDWMGASGWAEIYQYIDGTKLESVKEASESDLDKEKNALIKKVDVLIAKKKKLYSDVDITTPKSAEEKKLDKEIADIFSQINTLVLKKRKLKSVSEASDRDTAMVSGVADIVSKVKDKENRKDIASQMISKFDTEDVDYDKTAFLKLSRVAEQIIKRK